MAQERPQEETPTTPAETETKTPAAADDTGQGNDEKHPEE